MDALSLTHPVERFLISLTLVAFLGVVYWKAGGPPLASPTPIHRQPT
jgi:hypothetical protein